MKQSRRFSIGTLMAVVLTMAVDCAILRAEGSTAIPVLPMFNILVFGLARMRRMTEARPFWIGFEAVGWPTVGLVLSWQWFDWHFVDNTIFFRPMIWLYRNRWISEDGPAALVYSHSVYVALYLAPQLLVASVAGWLSTRYRIAIERRPPSRVPRLAVPADRADGTSVWPISGSNRSGMAGE